MLDPKVFAVALALLQPWCRQGISCSRVYCLLPHALANAVPLFSAQREGLVRAATPQRPAASPRSPGARFSSGLAWRSARARRRAQNRRCQATCSRSPLARYRLRLARASLVARSRPAPVNVVKREPDGISPGPLSRGPVPPAKDRDRPRRASRRPKVWSAAAAGG